jgi:TolA-binding protein
VSDLRRFVDGDESPIDRALFDAGRDDVPSRESLGRTLTALGIGTSALGVVGTASAASATAVGSKVGIASVAKWITFAVLGGAVVVGARHVGRHASVEAPVTQAAPAAAAHAVSNDAPPIGNEAVPEGPSPAASTTEKPVAAEHAVPAKHAVSSPPPRATSASLVEQVTALDVVRAALARRDAAGALAGLDKFQAQYPTSTLAPEAKLLRIEALVQAGDRTRALSLAKRFVARNPNSAHVARLEQLFGADLHTRAP